MWKPGCTAKWCALADAGRTRAAEGKLVANFSLPKSDGSISGFAKNGDAIEVLPERGGKKIYQSQVEFGGGKIFLLRAIVNDEADPAVVITVYRTSKIEKYWRQI